MANQTQRGESAQRSQKLSKAISDWVVPAFACIAVIGMFSALLAFLLSPSN